MSLLDARLITLRATFDYPPHYPREITQRSTPSPHNLLSLSHSSTALAMLPAQSLVPKVIKIADPAAPRDDRYLFVACLITSGLFIAFVIRYFVRQHKHLIRDHKQARDAYQESLRGIVAGQR